MKRNLLNTIMLLMSFIASFFFISCASSIEENKAEVPDMWVNNRILSWDGDTLTCVFYQDTITAVGSLKYGCFHYNAGTEFYGENVSLQKDETYFQMYNRMIDARRKFLKECDFCGDLESNKAAIQNLDIISIYSLLKTNQVDSALKIIQEKSISWTEPSRYADLYLYALIEKFGQPTVESWINSISEINTQDSIQLYNHWIKWQPISEFEFAYYQNQIRWDDYLSKTINRVQSYGI